MTTLSWGRAERLLTLVREAALSRGPEPFGEHVIGRLLELIPADRAGYYEYLGDPGPVVGGSNVYSCERPAFEFHWEDDAVAATIRTWPLADALVWRLGRPLILSDFLSAAQRKRNPWYQEVMRARGVEHEMKLHLPAPTRTVRAFFFVRGPGSRDFDDQDRDLLTALRPQLHAIREEWERRNRPALLTPRETEILTLVAAGLTNKEIAKQLVISAGTVRTHLENIFEKLDVHTRTAAAAAAFDGR